MAEPYVGIPAADRPDVEALNEVSLAIRRGVEAVRREPGDLAGAFAAGVFPVSMLDDVVRVALRAAVPDVLDGLEKSHGALEALLLSSESEVAKLTGQRDRALTDVDRLVRIKHAHWEVANRLRGALAVAMGVTDDLRGRIEAGLGASVSLLRKAAGEALAHGHRERYDQLTAAACEHESEGCPLPLADCDSVRWAIELLAEYRTVNRAVTRG